MEKVRLGGLHVYPEREGTCRVQVYGLTISPVLEAVKIQTQP